jgi:hypothetical protein
MHWLLRSLRRYGALSALIVLAGCGGADLTLPFDSSPATISKIDGDNQTGSAGSTLSRPLIVKVIDQRGQPVVDQSVVFTIEQGVVGARVEPQEPKTNSDGIAQAQWVLGGTRGTQAVIASVVGADGLAVRFEALVESAEARRLELAGGTDQSSAVGTPLPNPIAVLVTDQFGNPVPNISVDWQVTSGSVDPASSISGPDGRAEATWILGSSTGQQTATASSEGLENSPIIFTATALPGRASRLVLVSGNHQSGSPDQELANPLVVRLVDQEGNGVPDRPVSWVIGAGGGSVSSTTSTTNGNGEAEVSWTLGPNPGLNTLNAVVSGIGFVTFSANAVGGGGGGGGGGSVPSRLVFLVQPSDTEEDEKITPAVEVAAVDQTGDRVTEGELEIRLELIGDDDGKLRGNDRERTRSGVATFDDLKVDKEGEYRLRATADGLPAVESNEFEIQERD